ncbi:MAG: anthranilate phosphoribosyltransferase [Polyangiales bacterium]
MNALEQSLAACLRQQPQDAALLDAAAETLLTGDVVAPLLAAWLTAMQVRGPDPATLLALVRAVQARGATLPQPKGTVLVDGCGTGGDGHGTLNISTMTALVVAAAGTPVVKHGNQAQSSRCGSADLLAGLGIDIHLDAQAAAQQLAALGITFCLAPLYHPELSVVAPVRRLLPGPTLFNLVGPLVNPAPVTHQLVGVYDARWLMPVAEALRALGRTRAWVVHGADGHDELTPWGESQVVECDTAGCRRLTLQPEDFGLAPCEPQALAGGDVAYNVAAAEHLLRGGMTPAAAAVWMNAAALLSLSGRAPDLRTGVAQAQAVLREGRVFQLLDAWRQWQAPTATHT